MKQARPLILLFTLWMSGAVYANDAQLEIQTWTFFVASLDEAFMEIFLAVSPIGRGAAPEEISGMILHLCSDAASFTNGQTFIVDGGQTAH